MKLDRRSLLRLAAAGAVAPLLSRPRPAGARRLPALSVCEDRAVSRRDLAHVLDVLWDRAGGKAGVGVAVADIDAAIGRGHGDMRTPLNLETLADDGRAVRLPDGRWALTPDGVAWLRQDRDLSDR